MRQRFLISAIAALLPALVTAQAIDKPAATVRLHQVDVITVRQLRSHIQLLESRTNQPIPREQRVRVLDLLVGEKLIDQAAENQRVVVTDSEVMARIEQLRAQEGQRLNLGRALTDTEFRTLVGQTGLSWDDYRGQLEKALLQQKYVARTRGPQLQSVPPPSDREVVQFYEANKTSVFVQPDMVQFKHIYIDTRSLTDQAAREQARRRADDIVRELNNGAAFDELVVRYSDDASSRYSGGTFGTYLRRDDQATRQLLGPEFFEAPFELAVGETSGVLRSNVGFHIIRVSDKVGAKILSLDDVVNPQSNRSVREQIRALLTTNKQAQTYQQALFEILEELKQRADVRVFDENLAW